MSTRTPNKNIKIAIIDPDNGVEGYIDVKDDVSFPLALNYNIADIANIKKRKGNISKNFIIPATKANIKLLKEIAVNAEDTKDIKNTKKIALIVDDEQFSNFSKIKLTGSRYKQNKIEAYKSIVYGDNADWIKEAKNLYLKDIKWWYNEDNNRHPVHNSFTNMEDTYVDVNNNSNLRDADSGYDVNFCPVHYGRWQYGGRVSSDDLRPHLYIKVILQRCFDELNIAISSDFFDSNHFKKLLLIYTGNYFLKDDDRITYNSCFRGLSGVQKVHSSFESNRVRFGLGTTGSFSDPGNIHKGSTGIFSQGEACLNRIFGTLTLYRYKTVKTNIDISVELHENGVMIQQLASFNMGSADYNVYYDWEGRIPASSDFSIKVFYDESQGDIIGVRANSDVHVRNQKKIVERSDYFIEDVIRPDLTFADIIDGITQMFNLYWKYDTATGTIFFEPRDDFYKAFDQHYNWSEKIDLSTIDIDFNESYKQEMLFKYKEDSNDEFINKIIHPRGDVHYGDALATLPDRFIKGREVFENETFAASYFIYDRDVEVNPDTPPMMLRLWKEKTLSPPDYSNDFEPRVGYFQGFINHNGGTMQIRHGLRQNAIKNYTAVPVCHFTDHGEGNDLNLSFASSPSGGTGLYKNYWSKTKQLIEVNSKLTARFALAPSDVINLDLRRPVYLEGNEDIEGYWIINKVIDYRPTQDDLTKCELIKVIPFDLEDITTPDVEEDVFSDPVGDDTGGSTARTAPDDGNTDPFNTGGKRSVMLLNGSGNNGDNSSGASILGWGGLANGGLGQSILGRFNQPDPDSLFEVGVGDDKDNRKNAITVFEDELRIRGGQLMTVDSDGNYQQVYTDYGGDIKPVYLD